MYTFENCTPRIVHIRSHATFKYCTWNGRIIGGAGQPREEGPRDGGGGTGGGTGRRGTYGGGRSEPSSFHGFGRPGGGGGGGGTAPAVGGGLFGTPAAGGGFFGAPAASAPAAGGGGGLFGASCFSRWYRQSWP